VGPVSPDRRPPPLDKQCRATTLGQKDRGVYWSPPKRCGNYAGADGYCRLHQPTDQATGSPDAAPESTS